MFGKRSALLPILRVVGVTPIVTPTVTPIIASKERNLLDLIKNNNKISREELANSLDISLNTVKTVILRLKKKGVLERVGNNRTGYWPVK
jgi:ATP-dependent DNA helicase RecG